MNPYHDDEGKFTEKENANQGGKSSPSQNLDLRYNENNIPDKVRAFIEGLCKQHNVDLNKAIEENGDYNPISGKFANGKLPQNKWESYLLNVKYWEMLSEEEKKKETDRHNRCMNSDSLKSFKTLPLF